ncbi:efflux transporter outer membrane subunit [Flavobacterium sp.]|uniref:efflux transporter outer membrane subunit n=1 Tax=Flavobacterium sp. TaxID=239 RepID=UPI0039E434BE
MKKYLNYIKILLLFVSVASFAQQEKPTVPDAFRNASSTDTTSIADIQWKDFFVEKDLNTLIETALAKNNDLEIAQKNLEIASLQFRQAKWGNVPQINAFGNASSTRLSENSLNGRNTEQFTGQHHIDDFSTGLNLSWEADIWGKIRNRKRSARANYQQSAEVKKAVQTAVVANVSKGFYDLLMLDAQLQVAKETLKLNDSSVFIVNLQYESGQVTQLAKQQTEAQRLVAAQLIPQLEQHIILQENALSLLSGSFPEAKERSSRLNAIEVKSDLSAGIPAQLLSKRPDVKAAELALQAANANVGIAKASLYPSISITASGGVNAFEADKLFNLPASLFGTVAGGLTAPLLNGKRLRTQYEVAKLQRDQAGIQFRQTVLVAVGEVSSALAKIEKQERQFKVASERVATLRQAIKNANLLFKNGMANYLEVIIAQGNLLESRTRIGQYQKRKALF